jgi:hypothetical protein
MKTLLTYLFSGAFVLFTLSNCTNTKNKNSDIKLNNTFSCTGSFNFNHSIDSLLHIFIHKAKCPDCYYEMYIDKRDENEILIYLRASLHYPKNIKNNNALMQDYLKKRNPMLYAKIDNVLLFIYTGIEDVVTPNSFSNEIAFHKSVSSFYEYTWVIKKFKNKYTVYEGTWTSPFDKFDINKPVKFNKPKLK